MFGAIYIGLSGLDAYSRGLEQVSNNVTNLNTSGFKGSTVNFQNYFGTADGGGLSHTVDTRGAGNGVGIGDQLLNLKQGELRTTDRDLDLAVDGTGFLVLLDGDRTLYTRTGSFEVDKDGYIVLSGTDYRLATLSASNQPVSLTIDGMRNSPPHKTTTIKLADNLSSTTADPVSVSDIKVYDAAGTLHVWKVTFTKNTDQNAETGSWKIAIIDDKGSAVGSAGAVKFDAAGLIDPLSSTMTVSDTASGLSVTLDMTGVTSFSGGTTSQLRLGSTDGYALGTLATVSINEKGQIELGYSNSQKTVLGSVALADFRDVDGLKQKSGGLFEYEGNGERLLAVSDDPRVGQVLGKRIEASNVDLSKEFGDLILIQRGFQASSQIISVSNDMIQQLFGIRGQG
ncbi:flagellar hook protein FlgE [Sphingomonas sp.]|uniref:flagellar hook protein FlgE n=1 Tax=Sphingomonas sp. TaxID=28214 RepID=UPI001B23D04A|nr:flagellar hook-basal body complex protein [Sphingomonas sp.]MBO9714804.1 flagellar hook-basal body complex protein [Sphingomonas sp.]